MPYYAAGDYYGRGLGDYYRGDPGILKSIGNVLGGIARIGGALVPGPLGTGLQIAGGLLNARRAGTALARVPTPLQTQDPRRLRVRLLPPEVETFFPPGFGGEGAGPGGRRRRINPMNVKALRRASRRIDGFARVARRALRHTPFQLVSRGRQMRSPGVITRAEAARALRR
ncbi:MAG: hypothetical protein ACREJC_22490 [Tepidisphaeraceae bacterium]